MECNNGNENIDVRSLHNQQMKWHGLCYEAITSKIALDRHCRKYLAHTETSNIC